MATNKSTATAGTKRKLNEITAEQPSQEEVERPSQQPQPLTPTSTPPQPDLPSDLDLESPYAILIHFIGEEIFQSISRSTNEYAASSDGWKDTSIDEIKVFFGLLIYMSVNISPRSTEYWNSKGWKGPLHPSRHYMSLERFVQIKRYLRIPLPLSGQEQEGNQSSLSFDEAAQKHDQPGLSFLISRAPWDNDLEDLDNFEAVQDYICRTRCAEVGFANRDRSSLKIYGKSRRFPVPLPFPFLETPAVKAWRIQRTHKKQQGVKASKLPIQHEFRSNLSHELFEFARHLRPQPET